MMMDEVKELISEGIIVSITAKGHSMNPFIRHLRDQIAIGPWKDSQLKKGTAVLALTTSGDYVFHRIIKREGEILTLAGDGNIYQTERTSTKDVIGILYSVTRKGHTYSSEGFVWKAYSKFWMLLRPVRRYPLGLWRRLNPQEPL